MSLTTGEMFFSHTDAQVGELALTRTYNSARTTPTTRYGFFGPGWNSSFDTRLRLMGSPLRVEVRLPDGAPVYYLDADANGVYQQELPQSSDSWLETVAGGYRRFLRAGGSELYDASGRIQSRSDASGVATSYTWDAVGRLTQVARRGRSLTLVYVGSGTKPVRLEAPGGLLQATYSYDSASGRLAAVDYPDGSGYRYGYNSSGGIVWVRDAAGNLVETHEYDSSGRATTSERGDGHEKLVLTYGTNQTTVTDALGNATVYEWATVRHIARVTKVTGPCSSCGGGTGEVREWVYDVAGNVTQFKQAGDAWTYTYDAAGDVLTETDPLNRTTTYTYDAEGRMTSVARPGGGLTTTTHGPAGPLTITEKVTTTENRTTSLAYTAGGQVETVTDPRSKVSTFAYDAVTGDLLSVTDPLTHPTSFTYDALGRRTTVTDALNHTTTTTYDARGRVSRITQHDGTHTDFAYDRSGRRTSVTDPLGRVTRYVYDDYGQLTAVVDALAQTTAYTYDLMGRLTSLTDAKGQTTAFEYDGYGRVTKTIYPGGGQEVFTYDSRGRLSTKTDRKSVVTTYGYDLLGRLTGKTYSDGTTPSVSYTYDPAGRLETAANGTDTLTWAYDLAGQLLSEQSSKNGSTVAYTYDSAGNRLTLGLDGQLFVSYSYDDASRLTGITRGSNVFGFGYDAVNRRTSMSYPNGVATTYSYDDLSRLLRLKADKGATAITDFQYVYDAAGNRLSKQQLDYTETYGYDPLYRLTDVIRSTSQTHYSYDPVGNRLGEQADASVISGTFNEKNQLLARSAGGTMRWRGTLSEPGGVSFTSALVNGKPARMLAGNVFEADIAATAGSNTVTVQATDASGNVTTKNYSVSVSGNGATYTYDSNGNLAGKTENGHVWVYEWNAEDQLKRVLKDSVEVARFAYDPTARRVEKAAGGITTTYVYDGEDILKQVSGAAIVRYIHGPGIDQSLAGENGAGQLTYEHADALGSELKQTDAIGTVAFSRSYDAFGQPQAGANTSGYAFTGREWDPEVALYYYRARYYDPATARFSGEDPIGFDGGNNFYSYVGNGPTTWTDPLGLDAGSGMQPNMFKPTCLDLAFKKGQRLGGAIGYRYGHCMAACEARKCGYPPQVVKVLGYANEWAQTATCFIDGTNCHSARAPIDYKDNRVGFSCPDERTCEEQCSIIKRTPKKTRDQYGPHCKGPCREKDY